MFIKALFIRVKLSRTPISNNKSTILKFKYTYIKEYYEAILNHIYKENAHNVMLKKNDQVIKLNIYYEHSSVRRNLNREYIERT